MTLTRHWIAPALVLCALTPAHGQESGGSALRGEARKYLTRYADDYLAVHRGLEEARWNRVTSAADDAQALKAWRAAELSWAAFVGSIENIDLSRTFARRGKQLVSIDQRQFARIAYEAAGCPHLVPDLVEKRIDAENEAETAFCSRTFSIDGAPVSRTEVERILREERALGLRRSAWESLHEAGAAQKPLLVRLRWLSNEIVRSMGSGDLFTYRAREYGLSVADLQRVLDGVLRELRPLQTELHTFLRYELARVHGMPVPDLIPAHWLPDEAGSDALVDWIGFGATPSVGAGPFADDSPRALVERADLLWRGLGFAALPASFYEHSIFGENPAGLCSFVAHIDRSGDVRAIFDAPPTARGWFEAQDLVGRVHCELLVVQPEVPVVLRRGASRAFPGALAGAVAIGATHASTLRSFGLDVGPGADDSVSLLLVEALRVVVPIAHSGGTLFQFERDLYGGDADPGTWNQRWWTAAARFEGLAPPAPRDERWCDPAAEQRLFEEPAQGYDDAPERVIAFQIHDHIARKLLDADVHDVDIHGRTEVGDFVKSIARFGATVDWRTKLREKLGYEISARAIMEYFEPLRLWLERRNAGRTRTLPPM